MSSYAMRTEGQPIEGITVYGEAVRRTPPERAEFLIEVTSSAGSMAQAVRDCQMKTVQITQALTPMGVQPADVQTVSLKVHNVYTPVALPGYGNLPQIGAGGFPYGLGGPSDVQLGSYCARNILRINVREPARAGDVADAASRAGAMVINGLNFKAVDETTARKTALEAAGKDARQKAEALASAAGKQIGDLVTISEEILVSNGAYAAFRATVPFPLAQGMPDFTGELEYYARVSATYRVQ